MTQSIREHIKCRKGSEPEDSRVAWIYSARPTASLFHSACALFIYLFFDFSGFYYLCPLFCTSLHLFSSPRSLTTSAFPGKAYTAPPTPPHHHPLAALTPSSICSTDSWFPRGLRGDRDHRALWNLYAQISSWIRRRRRSAVALQRRRDEQGAEKIRKQWGGQKKGEE